MSARELRYQYFEQLRRDIGAEKICVAHHRDDAVETLLMNLMRGAGIHGLTGIHPKNGAVVRPMLGVSRQEIEDYLRQRDQSYVIDSTNLEPDVLRNRVRLQLLPLIEEIYPGSTDNIARSVYYLSEAEKVYNAYFCTQDSLSSLIISRSSLSSSPSPLCSLHESLSPLGFNRTQIEQILASLQGESGRVFTSPTHTLVIDRQSIIACYSGAWCLLPRWNRQSTRGTNKYRHPCKSRPASRYPRCLPDTLPAHPPTRAGRRPFPALRHERPETRQRLPHRPEAKYP